MTIVDYKVEVTKENGEVVELRKLILGIKIDRRLDMQTATANITLSNTIENLVAFHGEGAIVDNYNKVRVYIKNKIQFTGKIQNYEVNEDDKIVEMHCNDSYSNLLKPVDDGHPSITYENIRATEMAKNLCARAGINNIEIDIDNSKDYVVKKLDIKYNTQFTDVIDEAMATLEARARAKKDGSIKIEKLYPPYYVGDVQNNRNYDWYYETFKRVSSASAKRTTETLYSRLLVRYDDSNYSVFEEPSMIKWARGEKRFKEIDSPLSDTKEKRLIVANRFFLDRWRENTNLNIIATKGNPDLDLGHVVRLQLDDILGHYMVTGIRAELNSDGNYIDQIALEGMRGDYGIAVVASGDYTLEEKSEENAEDE
ncbi:hypothetical protein KPL28_02555 [Clostridium algidicarnis]|uniref:hypothetical protein n=1 Tax=Clostridium algidicarnis TaxID=37659 RepID=UPI001C0B6F68|nr:hypothetical protein [Clostridium algidicarnis]MBU3208514.1 hypothetical protein [Clostridium algidicarnis]